jgi:hypothetical protein
MIAGSRIAAQIDRRVREFFVQPQWRHLEVRPSDEGTYDGCSIARTTLQRIAVALDWRITSPVVGSHTKAPACVEGAARPSGPLTQQGTEPVATAAMLDPGRHDDRFALGRRPSDRHQRRSRVQRELGNVVRRRLANPGVRSPSEFAVRDGCGTFYTSAARSGRQAAH